MRFDPLYSYDRDPLVLSHLSFEGENQTFQRKVTAPDLSVPTDHFVRDMIDF